ncbi:MAG: NACHT domain-containing protein, partial [Pirellulales bacterium]|nr:NACHT domain-containing protein [Pirellulales bacterium]
VDYLGNDSRWPLVIHGDSGCGKSALAARAYQEIPPQKKPIIRFLGVTPRSCDLVPLLRSLCQELRARHPIAESLSSDVRELTDEFRYHLGAATVEQPVILFLDALDQLSEADDSRQLFWIPSGELPSHVKIVVSCASDPGENDPRGQPYVALQRRSLPSANMLNLNALSLDDAKTLLFDRWLPAAGRKTRDAQRRLVEETLESAAACRQPLYLKLLFEETRLWRSWDEPRAPGTSVPELLEQLCQRLSGPENHGELLVRLVLGYLAAARRGLSETEILEILFADPDYKRELDEASRRNRHILPTEPPRIPVAIWSRLRSDLAPYLTERAAPGSNVLTLYHRQISEWVRACYLDAAGWNPHARLAGFFSRQDYFLEPVEDQRARSQRIPPTARPANIRKADELPYQLLEAARHADPESNAPEAGEWNVAADLLSDWQFLEAKAEAQLVFELVEDFASAVSVMPKDHPRRRILTLIEGAIRNDVHFIDRLPTALFQCIWNLSSWDDGEQMLLDCLRDWASGKEQATPAFGWLRSLRPPAVSVHDSPSARISADGSSVLSVSLDKTGTCGLLGTKQGTVLLFDTASGRTTGTVTADQRAIVACSLSRNGFLALACSVDRVVRAYRRDSGYRLCSVWTAPGDPSACAISDSGRYACVGTRHGEVAIFDVPTATAVATYRHKDRSKIIWCAVDERRNRTVSLDADCRAVLTPLDEPAAKKWLKGPQSSALSAALLEDRNELVGVFTNGEIWFWDLNEMRVRKVQSVRLGEFSPHSDNLAFAVFGGSHVLVEDFLGHAGVVAWSLETGEPSGAVRCQGGRLTCMTAVPDGSVMLCGTANGLAHCWKTAAVESAFASDPPGVVWDLASHRTIDCERLHRNEFASIDAAGRITIWELGRTAAPTEEFSLSDLPGGDRNALLVGKRRPAGADGREPAAVWSPPARMAYLRKSGHWAIALCDGPILLCRRNSWEKISQSESRASGDVLDLSLSPDEAYLVVVEQNGQIASYRCPELKMVRSFSSAPLLCARGRWTADKLAVLFGPAQGGLSIWHAEDQAVERIVESSQQFTACDLSAGGSFAWGTAGGSAGVGRLGKNWQMELHARHRSRIAACALSPKADLLATTGQDGTVLVQGVSSNAFEGVFPLSDRGNCLCWLDETTLAVGTESGRVEILAVTRGSV